jgi:chromosome segregation and condensation protein ScpB
MARNDPMYSGRNLSKKGFEILRRIAESEGITKLQLKEEFGEATVWIQLKRMREKGYIKEEPTEGKFVRNGVIRVTKFGKERIKIQEKLTSHYQ